MADRELPNLGLKGFWLLGEDGWNTDHDLNLLKLSVLVQAGAISKVSATPGSPSEGDVHLFSETHPTQPNAIAIYDDGAWVYVSPNVGWLVYNEGAGYYETFDGSAWGELATGGAAAIADLTDVDLAGLADGQVLIWNATTSMWEPGDVSTGGATGGSVITDTTTARTASIGDANNYVRFTNGSAVTFTIPANATVAFPVGTVIEFEQAGAGALTIAAAGGVTINSRAADYTLAGQYATGFVKKVDTNTWTLGGDL